jgi:hypothetical protein
MLKELLDAVALQSVGAAAPQIKEADPTKDYVVRKPDGTVEFVGGRVPWRKHKAKDLETIAAFAERFAAASIWYSRDQIVLLTNDAERFDRVSVEMIWSKQIKQLLDLDKAKPKHGQRDFLFMLRTVFTPNAFPTATGLIESLRQVKFEAGSKTEGNIQRGKVSVGKEITAAATFLAAIPEQVPLSVPLFENSFMSNSYDVLCALEIYEDEQRLQLFPLPGEVEKAFAAAETDLCSTMLALLGKESKVPVYYGSA